MRVLHAITSGELGGAQVHVAALVPQLVRAGIDIEVVCGPGDYLPRILGSLVPVHRIPSLRSPPSPVGDPRSLFALTRLARGRDVVHTHSAKAGALGRIGARLAGVPRIVHTSHGSFLTEPRSPLERGILLGVERVAAAATTHLFVLSRADRDVMLAHGLYRSTPWDVLRIAPERVASPSGSWESPSGHVIVAVANHYANKGVDVLLRAFARIRGHLPDARLLLVGDGPERARLEALAHQLGHERIEFLGRVPDPTSLLLTASVFVLPSRKEGLPIALLEALALGVPAVATRVGAVPEIVASGEAALVSPDDPVELGAALLDVLMDQGRARQLSRGGRDAASRFVSSASIGPVLSAYTARQ